MLPHGAVRMYIHNVTTWCCIKLYSSYIRVHARPTVYTLTYVPVWENHLDGTLLLTATLWSLQAGQLSQVKHFLLLILKVRVLVRR